MADEGKKIGTTETPAEIDDTRREALAKMGRFAGYTAPAMMVLLGTRKARATPIGSPPAKNG